MSFIRKYMPFILSAVLMCVVLCIIYPHYQYYIDPDGISYLTISRRYAEGKYMEAINGYWSPWSCWLTSLLISQGLSPIPASVIINTAGATGFLYVSQSFFLRFAVKRPTQWAFNISLALFLCFAIFYQSFDDLWECFFLLSALRIMLTTDFINRPILWLEMGAIGACAYFAKAYSFPFFIISSACCTYYLAKDEKMQWLRIMGVSLFAMIGLSAPWILALHDKYGIWTTSTAGALNMSWYLVGHPHWASTITHLLPPVYPDSPYYWEDPYVVNGATPHFWNSGHLFGLQLLRLGLNAYKLLISTLQLSIFFPIIAIAALLSFRSARLKEILSRDIRVIIIAFCIFPLGYALINFESRYLWYMLPLALLLAAIWLQKSNSKLSASWGVYILALSLLAYPAWMMCKMYDEGLTDHRIGEKIIHSNIKGTFTSRAKPGRELQSIERIAYFSGMPFYSIPEQNISKDDILKEMNRYHVNYYLIYDNSSRSGDLIKDTLKDDKDIRYPGVYFEVTGVPGGIKIYTVNSNWKTIEGNYY